MKIRLPALASSASLGWLFLAAIASPVYAQPDPAADPQPWWDQVLNFHLFESGDHSVDVQQALVGLIVLVVGLWISHMLAKLLGRQLRRSSRIRRNLALLVERVVFYLLLVGVAMFVLEMLRVPLTTFAFVGGALAIGIGFGAQNILNNFISGLILMMEQPIRIGDHIRVDDSLGYVRDIGARCTRLRRTDGIDVLIPNSKLLENNVVNWTLTDDKVRTSVVVGVIYGSPTDKVAELILKAVNEHDAVIDDPQPPQLIFDDFGDNSLVFEVFFWTHADAEMQLRRVRSDIRFRVDALFREAGLVIAFPQRDVHLDTVKPLEVKVLKQDESS